MNCRMRLIGPRPEVSEFVDLRYPVWQEVLSVKPGITDAASLLLRDEERILARASQPEDYYRYRLLPIKLRLNLAYLQSRSFLVRP
jgi:lipopolysaccharide/colanic/teichoic acid biosynthesis glycosyltransferase